MSKGILVNDLIIQSKIDLFRLKPGTAMRNVSLDPPPMHCNIPRETGRGGGVGAIFNLGLSMKTKQNYKSFEKISPNITHMNW